MSTNEQNREILDLDAGEQDVRGGKKGSFDITERKRDDGAGIAGDPSQWGIASAQKVTVVFL